MKIEKTDNFKWAIWQCFPFLSAMSVTQGIGNCLNLDISDGEVCTVCTFLSKEEKVVKTAKNGKNGQKCTFLRVWPSLRVTVSTSCTCESCFFYHILRYLRRMCSPKDSLLACSCGVLQRFKVQCPKKSLNRP